MEQISKPFDSYIISYVSGYPHDCVVNCFNGDTYAGRMIFNEAPSLHYYSRHYENIVTILRYEKPLMLFYMPTSKTGGIITSEREPVGEQEGTNGLPTA